jgi:hypothetical protein
MAADMLPKLTLPEPVLGDGFDFAIPGGWNFRYEAQAMASWIIPACHKMAPNTALRLWACPGPIASFNGTLLHSEKTRKLAPYLF